ncbi:hypothetical protein CC79DRAFT_1401903 [Sarocladium strictum]
MHQAAAAPMSCQPKPGRRERKRETDRVAQREHRKRQKLYVEELEQQIRVLQSRDQSDVAKIASQNLRLKDELRQMRALWDEMEGLMERQKSLRRTFSSRESSPQPSAHGESDHSAKTQTSQLQEADHASIGYLFGAGEDSSHSHQPGHDHSLLHRDSPSKAHASLPTRVDDLSMDFLLQSANNGSLPHHSGADESWEIEYNRNGQGNNSNPSAQPQDPALVQPEARSSARRANGTVTSAPFGMDNLDPSLVEELPTTQTLTSATSRKRTRGVHSPRAQPRSPILTFSWPSGASTSHHADHRHNSSIFSPLSIFAEATTDANHTTTADADLPDVTALSYLTAPQQTNERMNLDALDFWLMDFTTQSVAGSPPLGRVQPTPADERIRVMVARAQANKTAVGPPSLLEFLADNPANTLSMDLKTYLADVRSTKRTAEYLATYWVLYLLLRWHAFKDESTYQELPHWLRPTSLQLSVDHPLLADVIAWPEIREDLIHMARAGVPDLNNVAVEVGKHLTVDIDTRVLTYDNASSKIAAQVKDISRWKLNSGFFDVYPQWRSACNQHVDPALQDGAELKC